MANSFAYFVISVWPIVVLFFINRYGFIKGALLGLLGAYMFLPAGFAINLPGMPAFDKFSVTSLTLLFYMLLSRKKLGFKSLTRVYKFLIVGMVITPFFTVMTNSEPYLFMPGLTLYDGLSDSVSQFLNILPFLIGASYFRTLEQQETLFRYFAVGAVIYAFLALYEIRMSPQLHNQIYGFFPHDWLQTVRDGGFRAIVFMGHGLRVALFLAIGVAIWSLLRKNGRSTRVLLVDNKFNLALLLLALVLMKSLAALIMGLLMLTLLTFFSAKRTHQVAAAIAVVFLTYPITSQLNLFPHDDLVDMAYSFNPERGQSLEFRFDNEEILLQHAEDKFLFGWGKWGRNRVYAPNSREDITVTDGKWILTLGIRGWFGFFTEFALIVLPLLVAYKMQKTMRRVDKREASYLAAHAIIISMILLDQMPNSSLNPLYWLFIGAFLGRIYQLKDDIKQANDSVIERQNKKTAASV